MSPHRWLDMQVRTGFNRAWEPDKRQTLSEALNPQSGSTDSHADVRPGSHGAFMREGFGAGPDAVRRSGELSGLRLAVKDVFDVEGQCTGCGNPAWLAAQAPATRTAVAVRALLSAGATWVGRTVTDELTYSLAGVNVHYGTPVNPSAPDRLPGGSSSGSAVAVAGGHADIGLGTDCGGSIRLPASYGGLWGIRPTHGRIAATGCLTLAHSFDTVGWLARDPQVLTRVFEVLAYSRCGAQPLSGSRLPESATRLSLMVADDVLNALDIPVRDAFLRVLASLDAVASLSRMPAGSLALGDWAQAFRVLQAAEVWQQHGDWFERHGESLGADIHARFVQAAKIKPDDVSAMQRTRADATAMLARTLDPAYRFLLMPTVPGPAPTLTQSAEQVNEVRARSQQLLCMAGLAGLPQVSMPWITVDGGPVGLALVGRRGDDEGVLAAATTLAALLETSP
jgi:amidase